MRLLRVLVLLVPVLAWAQSYPTKPVKMVIGFPAGGPADIFGRSLAQGMAADLGQTVIVENISGVGGVLGVERAVKSPGDGRDTANAALFLASDEARFITGTEIVVDGGMTIRCD